jgi:formate hydrogenlyase subunit 6/NADH:ubiquinone oxidoreductase subunit I
MDASGLDALIAALRTDGRTVLGPVVRDGVIVHEPIASVAELPAGVRDVQAPGSYRLEQGDGRTLFGWANGPQGWRRLFQAPEQRLYGIRLRAGGPTSVETEQTPERSLALVGARACDLAAIEVQDRVLARGPVPDAHYVARRADVFVVAVDCGSPSGLCFCASMGTGPEATSSFDVALTELDDERGHRFVARAGSERGAAMLGRVAHEDVDDAERDRARAVVENARGRMGRYLDTNGLPEALVRDLEHPRFDQVATRCLSCTNCTLVCPTCFCTSNEDALTVDGAGIERVRRWDSCFHPTFSHVHGGLVRASIRERYRQWITHKLSTWHEQFGESGCVGCGRCIAWCPAGIDITEEAAAIREARSP